MAITVVNISVTTSAYTVPTGKYGKFIANAFQLQSNAEIYIGDYSFYNNVATTVYSQNSSQKSDTANSLYNPSSQYITAQSSHYSQSYIVGLIREHVLVAGQTIYCVDPWNTSGAFLRGTIILQDV